MEPGQPCSVCNEKTPAAKASLVNPLSIGPDFLGNWLYFRRSASRRCAHYLQAVARKYEHDLPTLSARKDRVPDIFKRTSRSAKREMCRHTGRVQSFVGSRPTRLCFALCTVDGYPCNAVAKHMFDKAQCGLFLTVSTCLVGLF